MHLLSDPVRHHRRRGVPALLLNGALATVLTSCGAPTEVGESVAPLDTGPAERVLEAIADRAPDGLKLDLASCPLLDAVDVERSAPDSISTPPLTEAWTSGLTEDLSTMIGEAVGLDLGRGNNPTISCSGAWGVKSPGAGPHLNAFVLVNRGDTAPPADAEAFGGGRLDTDCIDDTSCVAAWRSGSLGVTINLSGTVSIADEVEEWAAGLVPTMVQGAATFDVDAALPPLRTPPRPSPSPAPVASAPSAAAAAPAPPVASGADCESRLITVIGAYATDASSIEGVLAAVPSAVAADARRVAEETRDWVANDSMAAQMAAESPALLFGSGAVISSLCAGG